MQLSNERIKEMKDFIERKEGKEITRKQHHII